MMDLEVYVNEHVERPVIEYLSSSKNEGTIAIGIQDVSDLIMSISSWMHDLSNDQIVTLIASIDEFIKCYTIDKMADICDGCLNKNTDECDRCEILRDLHAVHEYSPTMEFLKKFTG